jgi:DNA-binding transcriptional MerR regulator
MDLKNRFTIDDLIERTGLSRRTIRFYIERGLLAPPAGRGRGGFYDASHLARLLEIKTARENGSSLKSIKLDEVLAEENKVISSISTSTATTILIWKLAPGLSLQVDETLFEKNKSLIQAIISTVQCHENAGKPLLAREGDSQ